MRGRLTYRRIGKRTFDLLVSGFLTVVLFPVGVVIAVAVRFDSRGPILYQQNRVGADQTIFRIMKFRTMPIGTPTLESAEADGLEITRAGKILRRLSLDEIPQLINVLRNDMSLVGPRPAIPSQTELLSLRLENGSNKLKPGLTGLAQVRGFDGMTNAEKAHLDGQYLANLSLALDMKLILSTTAYLLRRPPQY